MSASTESRLVCYGHSFLADTSAISIHVMILLIILLIGFNGTCYLYHNRDVKLVLKLLFHIAIASAVVVILTNTVRITLCSQSRQHAALYALVINTFSEFLMFSCILLTLLVRGYIVFTHSIYKVYIYVNSFPFLRHIIIIILHLYMFCT